MTSLFASAPGGMMDMAIVSAELGANSAYVALLQLARLMFIMTCMVPFYRKIVLNAYGKADEHVATDKALAKTVWDGKKVKHLLLTLFFGCISGLALRTLGIPAGTIIGAMVGTATYNIVSGKAFFPRQIRPPLQIVAGAFIGMRMTRESILAIGDLIIPVIILFIGVIVITFGTAFIMCKLTKLDLPTCLLSSTPGGLTEMSLMAEELGLDAPKIAVLQTSRLMSVIIFFPTMLYFVIRFVG